MFEVAYIDKNGRNRTWQIASRAKEPKCVTGEFKIPDAVVIVPFHTAEKKIVITREYRVPLADYEYGFPAGLIDAGENIEQAACRELKEETGLTAAKWERILDSHISNSITDEVGVVYLAEELSEGEPEFGDTEELEIRRLPFADALHMAMSGEITDVLSLAGLVKLALLRPGLR